MHVRMIGLVAVLLLGSCSIKLTPEAAKYGFWDSIPPEYGSPAWQSDYGRYRNMPEALAEDTAQTGFYGQIPRQYRYSYHPPRFFVVLESYTTRPHALDARERYKKQGMDVRIIVGNGRYRVAWGPFGSRNKAIKNRDVYHSKHPGKSAWILSTR